MLSYRHAFHAGNHADVLKHFTLIQLLRYFNRKQKPYSVVDTHAGPGCYQLDSTQAKKNAEYESGISRLWTEGTQTRDLPAEIADYVAQVRSINPGNKLRLYPGSPLLALRIMRPDDRLRLFELHSTDFRLLCDNLKDAGRRAEARQADGFIDIKSVLPPPTRRGLVLIDPSYEDKRDYLRVVMALKEALSRFADGTYMVWYPQVQRGDARQLPEKLKKLAPDWLNVSLTVHAPQADGFGMHGSGLFIVNPPWTLKKILQSTLPVLTEALVQDDSAAFKLETNS